MRRYTKENVQFHRIGYSGYRLPAVNVKCYTFPDADKIAAHYSKDAEDSEVEKVMEWLFESEQESFWELAKYDAEEIFGKQIKVYSEGRSGGWLVVEGLKDFENWDAIDLAKWRKFERWMKGNIPTNTQAWIESMIETIDANEWLLTPERAEEKEIEETLELVREVF